MPQLERQSHLPHYDMRFVPASHGSGLEISETTSRSLDGDYSANIWERSSALKRIARYKPSILTVDSLGVNFNNFDPVSNDRHDIWLHLPGSPKEINDTNSVTVVAADSFLLDFDFLPDSLSFNQLEQAIVKNADNAHDKPFRTKWTYEGMDVEEAALLASLVLLSTALPRGLGILRGKEPVSRRTFLKATGLLGGLVFGSSLLFKKDIARYYTDGIDGASQDQASSYRTFAHLLGASDELLPSDWLAARNALYVLKTKDAMDVFSFKTKEGPAAILAGSAHEVGMEDLMESDRACEEAILRYTKSLFRVIDRVTEAQGGENQFGTNGVAKATLIDILKMVNSYEVFEPKREGDLRENVEDAIVDTGYFQSRRVATALKPLEDSLVFTLA